MPSRNLSNKRKTRKFPRTRRRAQRGGGHGWFKPVPINAPPTRPSDGPIVPEDILFQDADVCILKPGVKKGVLIFTHYTQPAAMPPLCEAGLKTGERLRSEGVNFGRSMIHNYIFFRAPYFSDPIDYTSIDTEIASSFGITESAIHSRVWIRIDPEKSNVYSSEIRARFIPAFRFGTPDYIRAIETQVQRSKKSMTEYLRILGENETVATEIEPGKKPLYNLFSSKAVSFPIAHRAMYPFDSHNINKNSEVLVRVPHLTPNYFAKCAV